MVAIEGVVGNNREKPLPRNKESFPMRQCPSSSLSKSRTVEEYVGEGTSFSLATWESAEAQRIAVVPVTYQDVGLYLPESILADTTAFLTSNGLPAEVHMGCGLERDIKDGLKY